MCWHGARSKEQGAAERWGELMRKKRGLALSTMLFTLCSLLLAPSFPAQAQQPKKIPQIGYLSARDPASDAARAEAIRLGLGQLGYIEGQNISIEYRYGEGKRERFPQLAAELVRLKVDI